MKPLVKVAFASGTDDLNRRLIERMQAVYPELPLYVVSEFQPEQGAWIPYHVNRGFAENLARARAALAGKRIRLAGVLLVPQVPYRRLRLMALVLSPIGFLAFNEQLDSFMLRPRCLGIIARHLAWRARNFLRWQRRRLHARPDWRRKMRYWLALLAGELAVLAKSATRAAAPRPPEPASLPDGISVVIPSRNGGELLERLLPGLFRELEGIPSEVIVVDNGSDEEWEHPGVTVERSAGPLSFARAVNRGIRRARYSHVCLLNNDMVLEPGFFLPLLRAFARIPDLFCATAQILFPPGVRREETGKAFYGQAAPTDFPIRCDLPLDGEDLTWVLYGSGGCSLYDAAKLHALGCVSEAYEPAYVEDLDLGYRAWQRGWPSVFVAAARVEHRHRSTTSRYYSEEQLSAILETNYLHFLGRAVASPKLFRKLWREAVRRLYLLGKTGLLARPEPEEPRPPVVLREELFLALCDGSVAVFPGRAATGGRTVLVASPYLPYPLSHGGAVRIYNLMRRASGEVNQVLVAFTDRLATPPPDLLDICAEIVLVRRTGSHALPSTRRPETVEEFDSPAFHGALRESVRKWRPEIAQLEFTQMAQYAGDCAPARTILVEHDITFELYEQFLRLDDDWHTRRQLARWREFETAAWRGVDYVVTMSKKDRDRVAGAPAVCLPNGVDLERFQPSGNDPEPRRLLFIGSFAHRPNVMAVEFFVNEVWPLLQPLADARGSEASTLNRDRQGAVVPSLHIIAGARHENFPVHAKLAQPSIEVEGFVADVRPAYERAAIVVAPLVASAGTNIKILEAMAMGKAIVSTPAGIHGLDLNPGADLLVVETAEAMAAAILHLFNNVDERRRLEAHARHTARRRFGWDDIARTQRQIYMFLSPHPLDTYKIR